jgi:hypothetical protein
MPATVVRRAAECVGSFIGGLPAPARCAHGERSPAVTVAIMAWALWLAVPLLATALAAVAAWWRGRPRRTPDPEDAMRVHSAYLDALSSTPRGKARAQPKDLQNPGR